MLTFLSALAAALMITLTLALRTRIGTGIRTGIRTGTGIRFRRRLLLHDKTRHVLEILPQILGNPTKPNGSKKIDGKTRVLGIISGENRLKILLHHRLTQPLIQQPNPKMLRQLLSYNKRVKR